MVSVVIEVVISYKFYCNIPFVYPVYVAEIKETEKSGEQRINRKKTKR